MNCINYHFTCMPNGYSPVTKMFKKLTKAPFAHLQTMGHNDSYLQGDTYKSCLDNTMTTIQALRVLGSLYIQRSQLSYQRKKIVSVGFAISSTNTTLFLTGKKKTRIKDRSKDIHSIRE